MNSVNQKYTMLPLKTHEEAIYFESTWYRDQMASKRRNLIAQGWIKPEVAQVAPRRLIVNPLLH